MFVYIIVNMLGLLNALDNFSIGMMQNAAAFMYKDIIAVTVAILHLHSIINTTIFGSGRKWIIDERI